MKPRLSWSCQLLLVGILFSRAAWASCAADSVIEQALRDELDRSMRELHLDGLDRPYFIAYRVDDYRVTLRSAILGSLIRKVDSRHRLLEVELRVGDYQLDNTNFLSTSQFGDTMLSSVDGTARLPLDDDYHEIRRQVWLATDAAYKKAASRLAEKRATLAKTGTVDSLSDFSPAESSRINAATPLPEIDAQHGERLVTDLSALLSGMRHLYQSEVTFEVTLQDTHYVNSEGSCYLRTTSDVVLVATGATQTEDGTLLEDAVTALGRVPEDLPASAELAKRVVAMGERLARRRGAALVERYNGPVLFEAEAAAELFAQVLVPRLLAQRRPVSEAAQMAVLSAGGNSFEDRLGGRVLPRSLSLVDDSTVHEWAGQPLLGSYKVDDEGVPAQATHLVTKGSLKTLLAGRNPVAGVVASSGNQRAGGVAPSNLIFTVEPGAGLSKDELRRQLLELVEEQGVDFGILVRKMGNPFFGPWDRPPSRIRLMVSGGGDVGLIFAAFKVYPDGREELLRHTVITNVSPQSFRDIVAVGGDLEVVHRPFPAVNGNPFAWGSPTGWVPLISMVTPPLLFEELTLIDLAGDSLQPPLIDPPQHDSSFPVETVRR